MFNWPKNNPVEKQERPAFFLTKCLRLTLAFSTLAISLFHLPSGCAAEPYEQAIQQYNQKHFEAALGLFHQSYQKNPKDPNALFYMANCYYNLNQKDSALQTYWTLISNFPSSQQAKQATTYLQQVAPDYLQKQQQEASAKAPLQKASTSSGQQRKSAARSDYTADDVMVVLRGTGDRQDCPPQLVSTLKNTFNQYPKGVRNLLGVSGCKIYITPSTIETDPRLQNSQPSGYEDGSTWKNCPGFNRGTMIVICAYVMAHDESGWVAADDPVSTLRHETGHAIDNLLGQIAQREEYKHGFLLDVGGMEDDVRQRLSYYTQKAYSGPCESFAEITCILLGGGSTKWRMDNQKLIAPNFPRSMKFVSQLMQNPNLGN